MKLFKTLFAVVLFFFATDVFAQAEKTDTIKVHGDCGMCQSRIEKTALKIEGVKAAEWDDEKLVLVVTYDASKTSNDAIQKKIASVGHDTEKYSAPDDVYKKLPGCCQYNRPAKKTDH